MFRYASWFAVFALIAASGHYWLFGVLLFAIIAALCMGMLSGGLDSRRGGGGGSSSDGYDDYRW